MWIVLFGPPGAGKGTQAARIIGRLSIPHLSSGEMLRQAREDKTPLGKTAADYFSQGKLVPDDLVTSIVLERLDQTDCDGGCLLDGFPRTLAQAKSLDEYLSGRGAALDAVLALQVDEAELVQRLMARGRADDRPEAIKERFQEFETQTRPILRYYQEQGLLREIDGMGEPDAIYQRMIGCLK